MNVPMMQSMVSMKSFYNMINQHFEWCKDSCANNNNRGQHDKGMGRKHNPVPEQLLRCKHCLKAKQTKKPKDNNGMDSEVKQQSNDDVVVTLIPVSMAAMHLQRCKYYACEMQAVCLATTNQLATVTTEADTTTSPPIHLGQQLIPHRSRSRMDSFPLPPVYPQQQPLPPAWGRGGGDGTGASHGSPTARSPQGMDPSMGTSRGRPSLMGNIPNSPDDVWSHCPRIKLKRSPSHTSQGASGGTKKQRKLSCLLDNKVKDNTTNDSDDGGDDDDETKWVKLKARVAYLECELLNVAETHAEHVTGLQQFIETVRNEKQVQDGKILMLSQIVHSCMEWQQSMYETLCSWNHPSVTTMTTHDPGALTTAGGTGASIVDNLLDGAVSVSNGNDDDFSLALGYDGL